MKQPKQNGFLLAAVIVLAVIFAAGAVLLLRRPAEPPAPDHAAEITSAAASALTTAQTTSQTVPVTTAETAAATTAPAETEPLPENDVFTQFIQDTLIPKYGLAAEGLAASEEQTGIAAAYRCDFLEKGAEDLLVVRLDALDGVSAPVPVLLLYTVFEGQIVLADTFESKLPLSGYRIRCAGRTVYISGDAVDAEMLPENWKRTEIVVQIQDNRDMILMDMEQGSGKDAPLAAYPENAELLLEMQPDDSDAASRSYMLYQYTALP